MQNKSFKAIFFLISVFIIVSIACVTTPQIDSAATEAEADSQPQAAVPTIEPEPPQVDEPTIAVPTVQDPTAEPTEEPTTEPTAEPTQEVIEVTDSPSDYFVEEFDGDLSSWTYFLTSGNESLMDLYTDSGHLVFDLNGEYIWAYYLYDEYTYTDVRLQALAENRGKNLNHVSLICNYSERYGWYEFNVQNNGLYSIMYWEPTGNGWRFHTLYNGGSKNIRMGKDTNEYTAICRGNELELYINGFLERSYVDNKYNLKDGQIGIGVKSGGALPILIEFDYFSISQP